VRHRSLPERSATTSGYCKEWRRPAVFVDGEHRVVISLTGSRDLCTAPVFDVYVRTLGVVEVLGGVLICDGVALLQHGEQKLWYDSIVHPL
jgi:hypothetical protein